jgi:hypothetical protein
MNGNVFTTHTYRLRSSGAVPFGPGRFLAQTFGVDKTKVQTFEGTTSLPRSDDFMGATIGGQYQQASFQRLAYLDGGGNQLFSGNIIWKLEFVDESAIPGA